MKEYVPKKTMAISLGGFTI